MLSSAECLAKAKQLEDLARTCANKVDRDSCLETAAGWRKSAGLALHQEVWARLAQPD